MQAGLITLESFRDNYARFRRIRTEQRIIDIRWASFED